MKTSPPCRLRPSFATMTRINVAVIFEGGFQWREVTLGDTDGTLYEVKSGLSPESKLPSNRSS